MLAIRAANERGHFNNAWLDSRHSFSFAQYHDPRHMGVSVLRVINEDRIAPGAGFPTHAHADMEIVSYVLQGALQHRDSLGNGSVIRPGDVQRMSAGSGVTHSEFNPSESEGTRFLQIWLLPNQLGVKPDYAQRFFSPEEKQGRLKLLVSPTGKNDSIAVNSDALMYAGLLDPGQSVTHAIANGRVVYLHVATGRISVKGEFLAAGDAVSMDSESALEIIGEQRAEVLLFDMPAEPG